ncbi:MAG: thiamine pyrophosphate-binding protein [Anaerocolumna sp.]
MKCSDFIAMHLEELGIRCIFGYQGGSITHLVDSISKRPLLKYIQNYNEQASSLCADAYARLSKEKIGAAIASNGPGATNLITGIANAFCDSIPVLFLTGQVHTYMMKKNNELRQESFQEIDILNMVKSITKYCVTIKDSRDIKFELDKAYHYATEGRPGPVLVDIPVDIQGTEIDIDNLKGYLPDNVSNSTNLERKIEQVKEQLKCSKRPLILVGGGINGGDLRKKLREIIKKLNIPVVVSLQGLDAINHYDECFIGFIGAYGNRYANLTVQNADFILILGSRLDIRQTGKNREQFASNAYKVHVEIDESEINHTIHENLSINCDLNIFFNIFTDNLDALITDKWMNWLEVIKIWKNRYSDITGRTSDCKLEPYYLISKIGEKISGKVSICSDVGQNQMWIAQVLRINSDEAKIINSGGLGTMGYSLPAGIAACYTNEYDKSICFMGDGGFQMNIQELCLIRDQQIPVKIFVLNNYSLGLIRQIHEKYYDDKCIGSIDGFSQPNFKDIAKAYHINYYEITTVTDIDGLDNILEDIKPYIINCKFSVRTGLSPELLGNDSLDNQLPYLCDDEKIRIQQELYGL